MILIKKTTYNNNTLTLVFDNFFLQVETWSGKRSVTFRAVKGQLIVEGGDVNATVTTADLITEQGVIHVIDQILGLPQIPTNKNTEIHADVR